MDDRPLPAVTADSRYYWQGCAENILRYQYCEHCQRAQFPPGSHCRSCHHGAIEWRVSAGQGVIYSLTMVERAPIKAFRTDVPYTIALVDLSEGFRIMAMVTGGNFRDANIGACVHVVYQAVTADVTLPQVKLTIE